MVRISGLKVLGHQAVYIKSEKVPYPNRILKKFPTMYSDAHIYKRFPEIHANSGFRDQSYACADPRRKTPIEELL